MSKYHFLKISPLMLATFLSPLVFAGADNINQNNNTLNASDNKQTQHPIEPKPKPKAESEAEPEKVYPYKRFACEYERRKEAEAIAKDKEMKNAIAKEKAKAAKEKEKAKAKAAKEKDKAVNQILEQFKTKYQTQNPIKITCKGVLTHNGWKVDVFKAQRDYDNKVEYEQQEKIELQKLRKALRALSDEQFTHFELQLNKFDSALKTNEESTAIQVFIKLKQLLSTTAEDVVRVSDIDELELSEIHEDMDVYDAEVIYPEWMESIFEKYRSNRKKHYNLVNNSV